MKVLVIGLALAGKINDNLYNVMTAASQINDKFDLLLIGEAECGELQQLSGVKQILNWSGVELKQVSAVVLARGVAAMAKNYTHVLVAADSFGKDLLPRVAGILDLSQLSEVIGVISPNVFKRPMYAGNVIAEVESFEDTKLMTIRTTSFAKYTSKTTATAQLSVTPALLELNAATTFMQQDILARDTIDLAHAQVVVSGGRSLGSKENFAELVHGLALKLGAAIGASRAAVEAGYAPNDSQVGQTGKVVAPRLYLAIGISGAVQHIAGMKDAKVVIAINLDANAQIFEYADYGLVGDLFEIVPQLINAL